MDRPSSRIIMAVALMVMVAGLAIGFALFF